MRLGQLLEQRTVDPPRQLHLVAAHAQGLVSAADGPRLTTVSRGYDYCPLRLLPCCPVRWKTMYPLTARYTRTAMNGRAWIWGERERARLNRLPGGVRHARLDGLQTDAVLHSLLVAPG